MKLSRFFVPLMTIPQCYSMLPGQGDLKEQFGMLHESDGNVDDGGDFETAPQPQSWFDIAKNYGMQYGGKAAKVTSAAGVIFQATSHLFSYLGQDIKQVFVYF